MRVPSNADPPFRRMLTVGRHFRWPQSAFKLHTCRLTDHQARHAFLSEQEKMGGS